MKIAICGLLTSENLGEWFIADSLKYLIETEYYEKCRGITENKLDQTQEIEFVYVDILANNDDVVSSDNAIKRRINNCYKYKISGLPAEMFDIVIKKVTKKVGLNALHRVRHFIWNHAYNFRPRFSLYYESKFSDVDLIVIDGAGLLEYSANEYYEPLNLISKYGKEHNIPIVYNAIGHSGEFDPEDFRCRVLMNAMQSSVVSYVSARDSADVVQQCAGNKNKVKLLADAAFWCKETYGITKQSRQKVVGIGLIRGNSLQRYNIDFGQEEWISTFTNIAKELTKRGYEYFFFTNGMPADYRVGGGTA